MSSDTYPITFINGKQQSMISVADRGLAYGDGLFETLMVVNGEMPLWSYHHARLLKGLVALQINLESQRLRNDIDQLLALVSSATSELHLLKIMVTRGEGGRGYQPSDAEANLILSLYPLELDVGKSDGVSVHICQQRLPSGVSWAGLKTLNQLPYVLAAGERENTDYGEGILLSAQDNIVEATARNVFIVNNEKVYTPLLDQNGVAGVMREVIIDKIAPQLGIECVETAITVDDFLEAEEIFLTNSITGVWPVIKIEQKSVKVGPVTRSIQAMCHSFLPSAG
ncbi:MAG: aminodeoxychorismate lyase [Cellvibrionaceae bacterium]